MKKTFERLAFMLLGAILVATSYFVGNNNSTADPEITSLKHVQITGDLVVKGSIVVESASKNRSNSILINADNKSASIMVVHNYNPLLSSHDSALTLAAHAGSAAILLEDNDNRVFLTSFGGLKKY